MSVIKNIVLLGWGVASLTKEKVEEAVEELIKRGEIASADRAKAIEELQQKAQAAAGEIKRIVDERIDAFSKRFQWSDHIKKLEAEIEDLKKRLEKLEASKES